MGLEPGEWRILVACTRRGCRVLGRVMPNLSVKDGGEQVSVEAEAICNIMDLDSLHSFKICFASKKEKSNC